MIVIQNVFSQKNVLVAGGEFAGTGGSVSFSYGQIDYSFLENKFTIWAGNQQVYDTIIAEVDKNIRIAVWPNPVVNQLYVTVDDINNKGITYQLFSVDGKKLAGDIIRENHVNISMKAYAPAVYILLITHVNKKIVSFKIIKK